MKIQHIALFAVTAALAAGCSPKNPPSGYGDDTPGANAAITTTPPTDVGQSPDGVLFPRKDTGLNNWNGDLSTLNPEAIALVVHFGFDKYNVEAGERAKIDAVVASLKSSGKPIISAGYTDHFGTEAYNLGLSDKRANSVKGYLDKSGVAGTDIRSFGSQFAAKSGSKEEVADDRKVVIIDTSKIK